MQTNRFHMIGRCNAIVSVKGVVVRSFYCTRNDSKNGAQLVMSYVRAGQVSEIHVTLLIKGHHHYSQTNRNEPPDAKPDTDDVST